jgi:myo-inositol-1(or 4)-monophosphatase
MRGSRLVTTERVVCFASPGSSDAVDSLEAAMANHDATLTVRPVGESLDADDWIPGRTLGVTVGGDGTFLAGVRAFAPRSIPFLGVNAGTVGFLARTPPTELAAVFGEVFDGEAAVADRQRFCVTGPGLEATGINEVAIERPMPEDPVDRKVCRLEVVAGGEYLGRYEGSGLVVAAPTGGTAIALSADGSLQYPPDNRTLQVVGLHTNRLGFRPVVLDADRTVRVAADSPVRVSVDGGRPEVHAAADDVVTITGADEPAHLVWTSHDEPFFGALAAKLGWGGRSDDRTPPRRPTQEDAGQRDEAPRDERARRVAREAACAAGEAVDEQFRRLRRTAVPDLESSVTSRSSERIAAAVIRRTWPDHRIRSTERTVHTGERADTWLVAPLDGRDNLDRGNPHYAVGVALVDNEGPVAGAVAAPAFDEVISAGHNGGPLRSHTGSTADTGGSDPAEASADGVAVGTTDRGHLDGAVLLVDGGLGSGTFDRLAGACEVRCSGSPTLALASVAAGRADACLVTDVHHATAACGVCLLRAAGGRVTTPDGAACRLVPDSAGERVSLVASNDRLHEALLALVE